MIHAVLADLIVRHGLAIGHDGRIWVSGVPVSDELLRDIGIEPDDLRRAI